MAAEISHPSAPAATQSTSCDLPQTNRAGPPASSSAQQRSHHKPRKFSLFMKRLANLKSSTAGQSSSRTGNTVARTERSASFSHASTTKRSVKNGNLQPLSRASSNGHLSFAVSEDGQHHHYQTSTDTLTSGSDEGHHYEPCDERRTLASTKSRGPAPSATTATTASAWSSPSHSVRSLTTTLTTVQSTAPGSMLNAYNPHPTHHHNPNDPPVMYSAPFPSHGPAPNSSALPNSSGLLHPATYSTVTANGTWSDNASILTLASSSKCMRRRSVDTDASVRALAPSSVFGGSRESLPLSVLSSNFESGIGRSVAGERASLYGAHSFKGGDSASVNGTGSIMGEISGQNIPATTGGSPLISPAIPARHSTQLGTHSRRSSAWEVDDADRKSLDARSASLKGDYEEEVASVKDGSSNVGVWHGVLGKPEKGLLVTPL